MGNAYGLPGPEKTVVRGPSLAKPSIDLGKPIPPLLIDVLHSVTMVRACPEINLPDRVPKCINQISIDRWKLLPPLLADVLHSVTVARALGMSPPP